MWAPIATIAVLWGGGAFILIRCFLAIRKHPTGLHTAGPYMPSSNPFRIGNIVLVGDPDHSAYNWTGTVMSIGGGMVQVRDSVAPYDIISVERGNIYPNGTVL